MKKTMTTVPFNGTAEQKAALDALIAADQAEKLRRSESSDKS